MSTEQRNVLREDISLCSYYEQKMAVKWFNGILKICPSSWMLGWYVALSLCITEGLSQAFLGTSSVLLANQLLRYRGGDKSLLNGPGPIQP